MGKRTVGQFTTNKGSNLDMNNYFVINSQTGEKAKLADVFMNIFESQTKLKIDKDVTLKAGDVIFFNTVRKELLSLVKNGLITQQQADERLSKIPDFVLANANLGRDIIIDSSIGSAAIKQG